jgi:hypothetical protein
MIEIARSPLQRSARVLETAEGAELNRRNTPSLPFGPRALPSLLVPVVLCSFRQNANLVYLLRSRDKIGLTT